MVLKKYLSLHHAHRLWNAPHLQGRLCLCYTGSDLRKVPRNHLPTEALCLEEVLAAGIGVHRSGLQHSQIFWDGNEGKASECFKTWNPKLVISFCFVRNWCFLPTGSNRGSIFLWQMPWPCHQDKFYELICTKAFSAAETETHRHQISEWLEFDIFPWCQGLERAMSIKKLIR